MPSLDATDIHARVLLSIEINAVKGSARCRKGRMHHYQDKAVCVCVCVLKNNTPNKTKQNVCFSQRKFLLKEGEGSDLV